MWKVFKHTQLFCHSSTVWPYSKKWSFSFTFVKIKHLFSHQKWYDYGSNEHLQLHLVLKCENKTDKNENYEEFYYCYFYLLLFISPVTCVYPVKRKWHTQLLRTERRWRMLRSRACPYGAGDPWRRRRTHRSVSHPLLPHQVSLCAHLWVCLCVCVFETVYLCVHVSGCAFVCE